MRKAIRVVGKGWAKASALALGVGAVALSAIPGYCTDPVTMDFSGSAAAVRDGIFTSFNSWNLVAFGLMGAMLGLGILIRLLRRAKST